MSHYVVFPSYRVHVTYVRCGGQSHPSRSVFVNNMKIFHIKCSALIVHNTCQAHISHIIFCRVLGILFQYSSVSLTSSTLRVFFFIPAFIQSQLEKLFVNISLLI